MPRLLILLFIALIALFGWLEYSSNTLSYSQKQEALDFIKKELPQQGKLLRKSDGYIYLKVDDNYIDQLYELLKLKEKGFSKPPYFRTRESPGAHITLFYAKEKIRPKELGKIFHFKVENIAVIKTRKGAVNVILEVSSPELQQLKEKYERHKKKDQKLHITIGKKRAYKLIPARAKAA